ncbi:MAG: DNA replication/repair protein RecF [Gammaproteobacteria bacterium HGW-Gammaproteobacteria-1]|jgi:DNA replication and repair protein RecF|nr:MAG: DNA replication/repair protein RecF [Gammaproteobacteria bacterium HGW-Gammaproteobacteria-1]
MALKHLEVSGLRNLTSVVFDSSPALNLLVGANGSGKTTVLEAIHLLGMARSFRTPHARKLIQQGKTAATIFGRIEAAGVEHAVGVQKTTADITQLRVDGQRLESASRLAEILPLQLITPESHSLLTGEPRERRAYLDWGLFHVEHGFLELWKRYRRFLEQRNAALRNGAGAAELEQWERGLSESGETVAKLRSSYIQQITPVFGSIYARLLADEPPRLAARRGWPKELSLLEALEKNRNSEGALGYTLSGPHRADFRLVLPSLLDAAETLSRGQQKLAVCALRIAQMQHLQEVTGRRCTLLLDDLPAELDVDKRRVLMEVVAASGAQCFVTATDGDLVDTSPWEEASVFHVEHGVVVEVV